MLKQKGNLSKEVTAFLDEANLKLRKEIEELRYYITGADKGLTENIKWNGPNYSFGGDDRITMRIQPPGQIQLIFHRGAKKQAQPKDKLIKDASGLLAWKENDRAVITFKSMADIEKSKTAIAKIVKDWVAA